MSSRELQALMEAAVDAVILIDHGGRVTAFNRSAERLFGYSSQELLGRNVSVLMPAPHRSEHNGYLERYASTGVAHIIGVGREVEGLRQDGTRFPAFLSVGQVPDSDPPRFVGFVRDVTTERQALATIQAARDRAEAHQNEAQHARDLQERLMHVSRMATMGEMAAGIAHELNQPLSAIATYARACERLLESADPDLTETRSSLHEIGEEAFRAGDIIRHLRQLVGGQASEHTVTDLNELIEDISVLAQADARVHTTQLELDLAEGLPRVNADRVQLQQVLLNLVRNALEALQELPAAGRKITICTTRASDDLVEMSVSDNGPGLSPAIADRLFTPFVTTKAAGTGLGLAISRTIVQAHDGKIAHRVRSPSGACFFVRVPAVKDEHA
jgi:two-component system sensor kinase FixL